MLNAEFTSGTLVKVHNRIVMKVNESTITTMDELNHDEMFYRLQKWVCNILNDYKDDNLSLTEIFRIVDQQVEWWIAETYRFRTNK